MHKKPQIVQRLKEIYDKRVSVDQAATERAIERLALSKEGLAREFLPLAVSNMRNYVRLEDAKGLPEFDFRNVTEDQWKAVKALEVTTRKITDEMAEVTKVKFWLHPKIEAGMAIAKLFGWIIERKEDVTRIEERLRNMTPEQREADAEDLYRRAMQRLLEDDRTNDDEPVVSTAVDRLIPPR